MQDFISRTAAENIFQDARKHMRSEDYNTMLEFVLRDNILLNAEQIIHCMPGADVAPVVIGEWIEENTRPRSGRFYCSVCHRTVYDPQPTRVKGWKKRCRYAYCPNCGAKMEGEKNGV